MQHSKNVFYRTDVDYLFYEYRPRPNVNFSFSLSTVNDAVYRKFGDM